jgi:hypothetical protein
MAEAGQIGPYTEVARHQAGPWQNAVKACPELRGLFGRRPSNGKSSKRGDTSQQGAGGILVLFLILVGAGVFCWAVVTDSLPDLQRGLSFGSNERQRQQQEIAQREQTRVEIRNALIKDFYRKTSVDRERAGRYADLVIRQTGGDRQQIEWIHSCVLRLYRHSPELEGILTSKSNFGPDGSLTPEARKDLDDLSFLLAPEGRVSTEDYKAILELCK